MDDSVMYTGVDGEGIFGNEKKPEGVTEKIREQEALMKELTPQLQEMLDMIDGEIKLVMSVDGFLDATTKSEADIRSELKARANYKKYLEGLKNLFILKLNKASGK